MKREKEKRTHLVFLCCNSKSYGLHSSTTSIPLTLLSNNDLDSVDTSQLVSTPNMCVSSAPNTCVPFTQHVECQRATGRNAALWKPTYWSHHIQWLQKIGSSPQSSCIFGWQSLSGPIMSCCVLWIICYCLLVFHYEVKKKKKLVHQITSRPVHTATGQILHQIY